MTYKILNNSPFDESHSEGVIYGLELAQHILMEAREGDRDGDFRSLISVIEWLKKDYTNG